MAFHNFMKGNFKNLTGKLLCYISWHFMNTCIRVYIYLNIKQHLCTCISRMQSSMTPSRFTPATFAHDSAIAVFLILVSHSAVALSNVHSPPQEAGFLNCITCIKSMFLFMSTKLFWLWFVVIVIKVIFWMNFAINSFLE